MNLKIQVILPILIIINLTDITYTRYGYADNWQKPLVVTSTEVIESKELDGRAKVLADYFAQHNSPLQYHAQDFIDAADTYQVDWKLVPSIAGVESTFGKFIPGGYNAWGWGVYGDQALGFNSWRDGIFTVTGGLKQNYIDKGLTDPYSMNRIYAASPYWGSKVSFFLRQLSNYASAHQLAQASVADFNTKVAADSAQLSLSQI